MTKSYVVGDKCPKCGGLIQIRVTVPPGQEIKYAQCSTCSWNSMR